MQIFENKEKKYVVSKNYNCILDKKTDYFLRCGKNIENIPLSGALEYVDIELSTIYTNTNKYEFLFKKDIEHPKYMKFNTFRKIIDILPKSLNHINFIVDPECKTNPDIWKILYYCNLKNISSSITVDNIDIEKSKKISNLCKSVSVNLHLDKNICYNTIKRLNKYNVKPNLNILVSKDTHHMIIRTLYDYYRDERLKNINSIFFIGLKNDENWRFLKELENNEFKSIVNDMLDKKIPFGLDNYLSFYFISHIKNNLKHYYNMSFVPCESLTFHAYIDINGYIFPCKYYVPKKQNFIGFSLFDKRGFDKLWFHKNFNQIRNDFISNNKNGIRYCPLF
jgi:hypothetical protein